MQNSLFVSGKVLSINSKRNQSKDLALVSIIDKYHTVETYKVSKDNITFNIGEVVGFYLMEDGINVDIVVDSKYTYKELVSYSSFRMSLLKLFLSYVVVVSITFFMYFQSNGNTLVFVVMGIIALVYSSLLDFKVFTLRSYTEEQRNRKPISKNDKKKMLSFLKNN